MNKILLKTPIGNSEILLQENSFERFVKSINKRHPKSKIAIITDSNVDKLYRAMLKKIFPNAIFLVVSAGEESKSIEGVKTLANELLNANFTRPDVIVGCGGGMVTDLAGFLASIYMRGIAYSAIPTSLLTMVDAVIGGKTGVNLEAKNILGTFYPAEFILIDPIFLKTLPKRELKTGMAEIIKYAAVLNADLADDLSKDKLDYMAIIRKSVQTKVDLVNRDIKERGLRCVLNFGHTFGHAIEAYSNYQLTHGEAVSIGMALANKVAQKLGRQSQETGDKIGALIRQFQLPAELPKGITAQKLMNLMGKDKKMSSSKITFIIAPEMGKYEMVDLSPEELVELVK